MPRQDPRGNPGNARVFLGDLGGLPQAVQQPARLAGGGSLAPLSHSHPYITDQLSHLGPPGLLVCLVR